MRLLRTAGMEMKQYFAIQMMQKFKNCTENMAFDLTFF